MSVPEPMDCLDPPCRAPLACNGWGYCRKKNFDSAGCYAEAIAELRKQYARGEPVKVFGQVLPGRLRDVSDGYRVATDALVIAADLGCSGDLYDALWALCQREAAKVEGSAA